jgi:hypothetical protein
MALNAAGLQAFNEDGNNMVLYAAIGSSTTSGSQTSTGPASGRIACTLGAASNASPSVITVTNVPMSFTGAAAAGATNVLFFSAASAGTFYGFQALTGDAAFNAAGQYDITALTITTTGV